MIFLTKKRSTKGFTLIELLVVIAIIGVLASIVLASLNTARKKSRDTRRVADMNQAKLALELYFDSNRAYPLTATAAPNAPGPLPTNFVPTFIASWPTDPISAAKYTYFGAKSGTVSAATPNACSAALGTDCQFFHTGATVEDNAIAAMDSRAKRCPNATNCAAAAGYSILTDTTVSGIGKDTTGFNCAGAAAAGQGCYDVTP